MITNTYVKVHRMYLQVYTGPRRKQNKEHNKSTDSPEVSCTLRPQEGYMVGFRDEDDEFRVGKVTSISTTGLEVVIFRETKSAEWLPIKTSDGSGFTMVTDEESVIEDCVFMLTKSGRLPGHIKNLLKHLAD